MTHLSNLQRDQFHTNLAETNLTWSTASLMAGQTINGNSSATVRDDYNTKRANDIVTVAAASWSAMGAYISPPPDGTQWEPYRFRGYADSSDPAAKLFGIIGYGPASPTGSDDAITNVQVFPLKNGFIDEVVRIKTSSSNTLPLFFGIAVGETSTSRVIGAVCVQRMSVASPTYSSSTA